MKLGSVNSIPFRGMIAGKTTTGTSAAVNTREIDKVEDINGKATQCSRYSYDEKKYVPIVSFSAPIDAVLKAYSSAAKDDTTVAQI